MVDAKHKIQIILETVLKGQRGLVSLEQNYRNISKNIQKNNEVIKEQSALRQTIKGDNAAYIKELRNQNREHKKSLGEVKEKMKLQKDEHMYDKRRLSAADATDKVMTRENLTRQSGRKIMSMNMETYQKAQTTYNGMSDVQKKGVTVSTKAALGFRSLTHGMRGFRMEALGVMFFGMAMQRMFMGLLRPVMNVFGIFDLFRLMLLVVFLPVMEVLFPYFLKFTQWFMDLPGPVKKAIGIFVLVGVVLGTILMVVGTLILGLGSIVLLGPVVGAAFAVIGTIIAGVMGTILIVIAIVVAVIIGMVIAWKENFLGMKKIVSNFFSGFKNMFNGIINVIKGIFLVIKGIFLGDWSAIWEGVKLIFIGLGEWIWGFIKVLVNGMGAIFVGIIRIVWGVIKLVLAPFIWLYDKIVGHSIIPDLINAIIGWFWKLPDMVKSVVKIIANAFIGVGNSIIGVWNLVMKGISTAIVTVLKGVDVMIGVLNKIPGVNIGKYNWNIGYEGLPNIPYLADGGIVTKPTLAMIGEAGPEAVIPLGGDMGIGTNITNNFYGFTMDELTRELDDRDRKVVDDLRRLVKT